MTDIKQITASDRTPNQIIADLKKKTVVVPSWETLRKEYDPKLHPVMTDKNYTDKVVDGKVEKVSRITLALQRLATKRMTELMFGIPVRRIATPENDQQKEVAKVLEKILAKNRINSLNIERGKMYFAGCEFMTIWYAQEEQNVLYGIKSPLKIRCRNFSPMNGDKLYPLFDEYDDMIALSVEFTRTEDTQQVDYFECYTKDEIIKFKRKGTDAWEETDRKEISILKIPGIYMNRQEPIWEDTSNNVYENEWALSRNGNYIRKNSKPILGVFADENIETGKEKSDDWRSVFQYPKGSDLKYITWQQATEALKYHIEAIYRSFFTELQIPDISYDNMKSTPMSGESRKMLFIDAHLKVTDESGPWIETLDREINVLKAFLKVIMPGYTEAIDALDIETEIVPYTITDDKDKVDVLTSATGGKPIISQREAVETLGWSTDVDKTMKELQNEAILDIQQPTNTGIPGEEE